MPKFQEEELNTLISKGPNGRGPQNNLKQENAIQVIDSNPSSDNNMNYEENVLMNKPDPVNNNTADKKDKTEKLPQASFKDLFHFVEGKEKIVLVLAILFSVAQGLALPLITIVLGDMTNSFSEKNTSEKTRELISKQFLETIYIGLGVLGACFVAAMLWNALSAIQTKKIKLIYFQRLMEQNSSWYDKAKIDQLAANFVDQVSSFTAVFSTKMHLIFMNYATAIGGIAIGFIKGWLLTIFIVLLTPIMFFGMFFFIKALQKSEEVQRVSYAKAGSTTDECFTYIKTVKSLNGEEHEIGRYSEHCEYSKKSSIKFGYKAGALWGIFFFSILVLYGLAYLIGSRLISEGWINDNTHELYNIGDVLTIFFAVITGIFALGNIGPLQKAIESAKVAIAMILKIVKENQVETSGNYTPETIKGHFVFENVSFAYPSNPDVPVLKNISFTILPGQKVAFSGPSGSGKSTIIQLLERFYDPTEGRILLDGVDLKDYNIDFLRKQMGLVSQQPVLFAESIKYNILLGIGDRETVGEQQIWEALDRAVASEFVKKFNNGLNEFVGSQGGQLSGGQKQRIAIARALIRQPKVFLFDEATSALDRRNEIEIQKTLDKIAQNTTTLTVAHRLTTIRNSDCIFILQNGVLASKGTHDELMKDTDGLYYKLVEHQLGDIGDKDEGPNENAAWDMEERVLLNAFNNSELNNSQKDAAKSLQKFSSNNMIPALQAGSNNSKILPLGPKGPSGQHEGENANPELEDKKLDKEHRWTLRKLLGPEKHLIGIGILVAMAQGSIMPIFGYLLGLIIERLSKLDLFKPGSTITVPFTKDDVMHDIDLIIIAFMIVAFGSFVFSFLQFAIFNQIGEMFTFTLRTKYFRRLMYEDMDYFDREENQPGAVSSRLALECKTINTLVGTYIGSIFQSISSFLVGLIIGLIFSWRISLVMLAMTPLLFLSGLVDTQMMSAEKSGQKIEGSDILPETLNNMKVVRSLAAQKGIYQRFEQLAENHRVKSLKMSWISSFLFGVSQFSMFLLYAVIFRVGSIFLTDYNLDPRDFFVAIFAIIFGGYGAGMANQFIGGIGEAKVSAKKILSELNAFSSIEVDPLNPAMNPIPRKNLKPQVTGKIEFKNVNFTYRGRKNRVLNNMNFVIAPNQASAFVGGSGSGKSTIMQMILRFYDPQKGSILIDDIDIKDIDITYLRSVFGIVRQEPTLFNGTIDYNIKYNRPDISPETINQACEAANCLEFIYSTPEGFARDVGNRGEKMSGGQKQRLAIARILVRNPLILLFDEATSALDSNSEAIVQNALERISKDRASVSIAHRISTIKGSDTIFVVELGRIIEQGTYANLMSKKGRFTELAQS